MRNRRHPRLAETQTRLDALVSIRTLSGFTLAQKAEYIVLTDVERVLLGASA